MSSKRILDIRKPKKAPATQSRVKARAAMTPLFPQKATRLRARRRKMRLVMFVVCLMSAAGIVGILGLASHAERLAVKEVSVSGAQALSPDSLVAAVQEGLARDLLKIFSGHNIFLYPARTIEKNLAATFPRIKDVELSRSGLLAQAIVVTVKERQPFAKWCSPEACFAMDETGFVYAEAGDEAFASPYVFRAGLIPGESEVGQFFLQGRFRDIIRFFDLLKGAGYPARELRVENEKDFTVALESGFSLLVPFDAELDGIVRNLKLALEADAVRGREGGLQHIDLRFGNRVYYKFRGE